MPHYRKHGKILTIITEQQFAEGMTKGDFIRDEHRAYPVGLYYSAVRKMELLRAIKDQFRIEKEFTFFDVGPRLKKIRRSRHGKPLSQATIDEHFKKRMATITTPPLPLPNNAPFMDQLIKRIEATESGELVFPWSPKTAYNIIDRVFAYPHLFRLSRITWFFLPHPEINRPRGYSIPEVRTWTGLSLAALDYYIGRADVSDMGRSMYQQQRGLSDAAGNV